VGDTKCAENFGETNYKGAKCWDDQVVDGGIILKWTLSKSDQLSWFNK
jgi:hypothetical protein